MFVVDIRELTLISRNGRDQINSSAALRMSARVRSDFTTFAADVGLTRNCWVVFFITDVVSEKTDSLSSPGPKTKLSSLKAKEDQYPVSTKLSGKAAYPPKARPLREARPTAATPIIFLTEPQRPQRKIV